jgi:N-acetylneuraminate synthase
VEQTVTLVAEAGVNHNGDAELALRLVEAASRSGADAVKFQAFNPDLVASPAAPKAAYQVDSAGMAATQLEMLRDLALRPAAWHRLASACGDAGIRLMATAFDVPSLHFLTSEVGLDLVKIGSGDVTNAQLLRETGRLHCDVVLSTGMSTADEVAAALGALRDGRSAAIRGSGESHPVSSPGPAPDSSTGITLLHCTSQYPAPLGAANLRAMDELRSRFGLPVGYSDHTEGILASVAAVARGAVMIEKHLTLDRTFKGPDHRASLEPIAFAQLARALRETEEALGDGRKGPQPCEAELRASMRRSIAASRAIRAGEVFTTSNVAAMRPGTGVSAMRYWEFIGVTAHRDYAPGELIEA